MSNQEQNRSPNTNRQHRNSTNQRSRLNQTAGQMDEAFFGFSTGPQPWSSWHDVPGQNYGYSTAAGAEQTMRFSNPFGTTGREDLLSASERGGGDLSVMYSTSPSITIDVPPLEPIQQYGSFPGYSSYSESLPVPSSSPLLQPGLQVLSSQPSNTFQTFAGSERLSPRDSLDMEEDDESATSQQGTEFRCWEHGCAGRSFSSASNFRRHRQEQAGLRRKWNCTHCGREFTRSTARNNHMRDGHCLQRKTSNQSQSGRKSRSPG